jgi:dsDNA-binding SOS-regulon protein
MKVTLEFNDENEAIEYLDMPVLAQTLADIYLMVSSYLKQEQSEDLSISLLRTIESMTKEGSCE